MKDPAFLFYPNDYIGGTMGMTFEQKGAYIEVLMIQFNRGHMTEDMIRQTIGDLWDNIKDKFVIDNDGKYYNVRLQLEKEKRQNYTHSRRNNKLGTNQHTSKSTGHMTKHMENVNEDVNSNSTTTLKEVNSKGKPSLNDFIEYAKSKKPNIDVIHVKSKYESWVENGWKDGNDKEIKNWKIKLNNTLPYLKEIKQAGKMSKEELDKLLRPTL